MSDYKERIKTIDELDWWVLNRPFVLKVVKDTKIGRKKASETLYGAGLIVSEKLIRTWREKNLTPIVESPIATPAFTEPIVKQGKAIKSKTIVIMPDVQAPLHDEELVNKFVDFIYDFQPTEIGQVGDFTDSTEISRWVRGKKQEYAGDLRGGFLSGQKILKDIREVFDGRFRIVRSNHDDRLELYIAGCAAGLASFGDFELSFESLMHLAHYDVEFVRDGVIELFDNWVMAHGDEGSLSPQAGKTAFGLAKNKFGVNVVCGHTHRAGVTSESYGYNGKIHHSLTGLEVGHFMDIPQAQYLDKKGGAANWQQAFGILEQVNGKVFPHLVPVIDSSFSFEGVSY